MWQATRRQCDAVGELVNRPQFRGDAPLCDQINRAALSVVFNITEGFLRRLDRETSQFLRYAFASNGEVKAGYYAAAGRHYLSPEQLEDLVQTNESIARMLRRWQATLDSSRPARTKDQGRTRDQGRTKDQEPSPKDQH